MGIFSKKPRGPVVPEGVTERWSQEDQAVIVTLPFDQGRALPSEVADRLSNELIATINAVQGGEFGHSIPEDVTSAKVSIEVNTGAKVLGEIPMHTVEILRERLGKSMDISVVTDPDAIAAAEEEAALEAASAANRPRTQIGAGGTPEIPKFGPDGKKLKFSERMRMMTEMMMEQQQNLNGVLNGIPDAVDPTEGLTATEFVWNPEDNSLDADVVFLGEPDSDAQTAADINDIVEKTIASLGTPEVKALIPEGNTSYGITLTVAVNEDAAGPATKAKLEQGEKQFAGTRVEFISIIDPRADIEAMVEG